MTVVVKHHRTRSRPSGSERDSLGPTLWACTIAHGAPSPLDPAPEAAEKPEELAVSGMIERLALVVVNVPEPAVVEPLEVAEAVDSPGMVSSLLRPA